MHMRAWWSKAPPNAAMRKKKSPGAGRRVGFQGWPQVGKGYALKFNCRGAGGVRANPLLLHVRMGMCETATRAGYTLASATAVSAQSLAPRRGRVRAHAIPTNQPMTCRQELGARRCRVNESVERVRASEARTRTSTHHATRRRHRHAAIHPHARRQPTAIRADKTATRAVLAQLLVMG